MDTFGVCIPCHVESEADLELLTRALKSIESQTRKPLEIVLSDDTSNGLNLEPLLKSFANLNLRILKNNLNRGIANNSNHGVLDLGTEWIHVLHQDDWLASESVYETILDYLSIQNLKNKWIVLGGIHEDNSEIIPKWNDSILFGFNTIGGPSCLITRKSDFINFDPRFTMLVDVKNFSDYFIKYGHPAILESPVISYGDPKNRVSRNITAREYQNEINSVIKIESISTAKIIKCLQNYHLNSYQRSMVAKAALRNKKISFKTYTQFSISFVISRFRDKIYRVQN